MAKLWGKERGIENMQHGNQFNGYGGKPRRAEMCEREKKKGGGDARGWHIFVVVVVVRIVIIFLSHRHRNTFGKRSTVFSRGSSAADGYSSNVAET